MNIRIKFKQDNGELAIQKNVPYVVKQGKWGVGEIYYYPDNFKIIIKDNEPSNIDKLTRASTIFDKDGNTRIKSKIGRINGPSKLNSAQPNKLKWKINKVKLTEEQFGTVVFAVAKILITKYSKEDVFSMLRLKMISSNPNEELWTTFENGKKPLKFLYLKDYSIDKSVILRVPHKMNDVQKALAWSFSQKTYSPEVQT